MESRNIRLDMLLLLMCQTLFIVRLHRMHEVPTVVIDDPVILSVCRSVSVYVCQCVYHVALLRNTAEWIEVLCRMETPGDPRNVVLDGSPDFPNG